MADAASAILQTRAESNADLLVTIGPAFGGPSTMNRRMSLPQRQLTVAVLLEAAFHPPATVSAWWPR